MTRENRNSLVGGLLWGLGLACILALVAYAADGPFAGRWKGELKSTPADRGSTPGTGTSSADGTGTPPAGAEPSAPPSGGGRGGGGFGGGRGGGGFGGGGFGGGGFSAGPQKVSLNLKQSKDDRISGNITFGDQNADDVKDGQVVGNTITFKAGRAPQPIYEYYGELKGNELVLTRNVPGGRGGPQEIVLTKK